MNVFCPLLETDLLQNLTTFSKDTTKRTALLERQQASYDNSTLIVLDSAELEFHHASYFVPSAMTTASFVKFVSEQNVKTIGGQPVTAARY